MQPDGPTNGLDGPTWTNLPKIEPGASPEPGGAPTWPEPRSGSRRSLGSGGAGSGSMYTTILGISFFANVVLLIALIAVLALARGGYFAPRGSGSGAFTPVAALGTPTATATFAPSPSPATGWLQVTPNTVHLGCNGDQRTQVVVLANNGQQKVRWQVSFSGSGDQAPLTVNPNQGDLHAGATVAIQIQFNPDAGGGQQGVIQFTPDSPDAGTPPTISYVTDTCNN